MHHDRIDGGLLQKHDVAGEVAGEMLIAHGVAAVFHDDDLLVVALHIGQRFGQDTGLHLGAYGVACAHRIGLPGNLLAKLM